MTITLLGRIKLILCRCFLRDIRRSNFNLWFSKPQCWKLFRYLTRLIFVDCTRLPWYKQWWMLICAYLVFSKQLQWLLKFDYSTLLSSVFVSKENFPYCPSISRNNRVYTIVTALLVLICIWRIFVLIVMCSLQGLFRAIFVCKCMHACVCILL